MSSLSNPHPIDTCKAAVAKVLADVATKLFGPLASLSEDSCYGLLERPPESALGDYALPCFRLAKDLRRKPADIAQDLASALSQVKNEWIVSAQGAAGFLNLRVDTGALARELIPALRSGTFFEALRSDGKQKPRVMIEYSQPNTHKVFHVGHMRNVALGDSLGRLYEFCGYPVVMANYIGDEGAHIAKCIWHIRRTGAQPPETGKGVWLGEMYVASDKALAGLDPAELEVCQKEISAILREIESKQGSTYDFWKTSRQWSLDDFDEIYHWIGARFDHVFCESEVSDLSQKIVDKYLAQGLFVSSDGAIGLDLKDEKLGFVIVRKSDGNTTYATKDLALAGYKFEQFNIEKSIYVVASEQNLHFKQVFRTLEKMGFPQAKNCFHLSYGMVVAPDGKMSSRKGNCITFAALRTAMSDELDKNLEKYRGEWANAEIESIRQCLAIGAIRYGMICSDPAKDIVFDLKDWLSFEGNTGPYLMYSFARTRSILRKAWEQNLTSDGRHIHELHSPEEHELLRLLSELNLAISQSCEFNKPSVLAHYLFDLCKVYNRFLANVSVLKAESITLREARLGLLEAFSVGLKQGLRLLGIDPPERM